MRQTLIAFLIFVLLIALLILISSCTIKAKDPTDEELINRKLMDYTEKQIDQANEMHNSITPLFIPIILHL